MWCHATWTETSHTCKLYLVTNDYHSLFKTAFKMCIVHVPFSFTRAGKLAAVVISCFDLVVFLWICQKKPKNINVLKFKLQNRWIQIWASHTHTRTRMKPFTHSINNLNVLQAILVYTFFWFELLTFTIYQFHANMKCFTISFFNKAISCDLKTYHLCVRTGKKVHFFFDEAFNSLPEVYYIWAWKKIADKLIHFFFCGGGFSSQICNGVIDQLKWM